jgi:putative transport protein
VLELGDRVRVLAPKERLDRIADFFGDSYRALSEIDVMGFSLGLALGLAIGMIPIPLPGGATLRLGFAGGPLVSGLILGARGFTGPLVWTVPYSTNLTLRQIGLVLFLAGIGTRAGYSFYSTVSAAGGLRLLAAGAVITVTAVLVTLWVGHRLLRIPMSLLTGMLAGTQTQPAVLGFASEQTRNDLPQVGYATVYPLATIGKIIIVQLLLGG